jgi:hypothetical protein
VSAPPNSECVWRRADFLHLLRIVRKAVLSMVAMKRLSGHSLPAGATQLANDIDKYKQDAEQVPSSLSPLSVLA